MEDTVEQQGLTIHLNSKQAYKLIESFVTDHHRLVWDGYFTVIAMLLSL